jgi:hypothetical protein
LRFANMQPAARRNCCRSWIIEARFIYKKRPMTRYSAFLKRSNMPTRIRARSICPCTSA